MFIWVLYIGEAFNVPLNDVVKFFILIIVLVFDPLAVALIGPVDPVSNEQMWWDKCSTSIVEEVLDDNTSVYYCEDDPPVVPVDDKWWRRFDTKLKPLPRGVKFIDRIKNGEYEFSHYYWQWKLSELEINEKYIEYNGDVQKLLEKNGVDLARRKRLIVTSFV